SPDGKWLAIAGFQDQTVRVYGTADGAERFRLTDAMALGAFQIAWTPAGDLAVVGMLETLRVWHPEAAPLCDTWYRQGVAGRLAFSPDGRWLAAFTPTTRVKANVFLAEFTGAPAARPDLDRITVIDRRTGQP